MVAGYSNWKGCKPMKFGDIANLVRFWNKPRYHRDIIKHFFWNKDDARRLKFYRQFVKPGQLVFDVGANMGNRSKIFLELGARVVAFEPQPYCATFLATAFHGNPRYTLLTSALSNQETQLTMHLSKTHTLSTIDEDWLNRMHEGGRFQDQKWDKHIAVRTTTLDQAIDEHGLPGFIKIDVEGHELNVVQGLSRPVRHLSLEFASESLDRTFLCLDHLDSIGTYRYGLSFSESMCMADTGWLDSAALKRHLLDARNRDPMTWGDVYAKLESSAS